MKKITIGRNEDNDIRINDKSVSRHHGYLLVDGSRVYIVDDDSMNGTYVNGKRINEKALLSSGDKVLIAQKFKLDWQSYVEVDVNKTIRNEKNIFVHESSNSRPQNSNTSRPSDGTSQKSNEFWKTVGKILKYIITTIITMTAMALITKWLR